MLNLQLKGRYFWNFLKFRMSENRISEIHKAKDPMYHGGPRVKKSTFFCGGWLNEPSLGKARTST